jgi:hypothetical protein
VQKAPLLNERVSEKIAEIGAINSLSYEIGKIRSVF